MRYRGVCARATDLVAEVEEVLQAAEKNEEPLFDNSLRLRLVDQTLNEIHSDYIDDYDFERLVATVLKSLGASEVQIRARSTEDKGADIIATFLLATTFEVTLAVQAKHYQPDPPVGVEAVDQLVRGMEAEGTYLGWVATSGVFSEEVSVRKTEEEEKHGFQIELVDGEQLAAMIVEGGLKSLYEE